MANQSRGREEMKVDSVSLIPSISPAPAKKRSTTAKKKKPKPKPTPNPYDFVSSTPLISPAPAKKRKTSATRPTLMSLPYELVLNCLARVSRLYYPTLSLVSKRFRSLLASPELYKVRSLIDQTESCLYVCLTSNSKSFWFTLCLKPGKESEKRYVLARVPVPYSRHAWFSDLVVVGSSIYQISTSSSSTSPPSVSILDCRSHTWRKAPSMRMELLSYTPSVLDEKIYVAGYGKNGDSGSVTNSIEVFDTKTEIWDPAETSPCSEIYRGRYYRTISIAGKLYVVFTRRDDVVAYNAKECRWDKVRWTSLLLALESGSYCEIDNVFYSIRNGMIGWCDVELNLWSKLKGLVGLPEFPPKEVRTCVRLANYGGKMAVFWNKKSPNYRYNSTLMNWCAVIKLERRQESCEIWGQVEWCGHVLTRYEELVKSKRGMTVMKPENESEEDDGEASDSSLCLD